MLLSLLRYYIQDGDLTSETFTETATLRRVGKEISLSDSYCNYGV